MANMEKFCRSVRLMRIPSWVALRPLQRFQLACEPLLQVGEQVGRGYLARFSGVGSWRVPH
jgi:hypothetical protein